MKIYTKNQIVFAEAENIEDVKVLLSLGSRWPKADTEKQTKKRGVRENSQSSRFCAKLDEQGYVTSAWCKSEGLSMDIFNLVWIAKKRGYKFDASRCGKIPGTGEYLYTLEGTVSYAQGVASPIRKLEVKEK